MRIIITILLIPFFSIAWSTDQNNIPTDKSTIEEGKKHFLENCYACHSIGKEKIGPALGSVPDKRELSWLQSFIRNSQEVILSGDSVAVFLSKSYNRQTMPAFTKLTQQDIVEILAYIKDASLRPDTKDAEDIKLDFINNNYIAGQVLFDAQCATCHAIDHKVIGPALASIPKTRDRAWLHRFIRNSKDVIASGDNHANFLYNQFDQTRMPAFEFLSTDKINNILDYIETECESPNYTAGINGLKLKSNPNKWYSANYAIVRDYGGSNPYKDPINDRLAIKHFFQAAMFLVLGLLVFIMGLVGVKSYKALRRSSP